METAYINSCVVFERTEAGVHLEPRYAIIALYGQKDIIGYLVFCPIIRKWFVQMKNNFRVGVWTMEQIITELKALNLKVV